MFLMQYNGGIPSPAVFGISGSRHQPSDEIDYFLGINTGQEYDDVDATTSAVRDRISIGHIVIAQCSCGAMLLLKTGGSSEEVLYWDDADCDDDGETQPRFVAPSFSKLLDTLRAT
jgi:hypothetical protein